MSDQKRGARETGSMHDDGPGRWWLAWFTLCAVLGLGALAVLTWAVIRLVTRYAG